MLLISHFKMGKFMSCEFNFNKSFENAQTATKGGSEFFTELFRWDVDLKSRTSVIYPFRHFLSWQMALPWYLGTTFFFSILSYMKEEKTLFTMHKTRSSCWPAAVKASHTMLGICTHTHTYTHEIFVTYLKFKFD